MTILLLFYFGKPGNAVWMDIFAINCTLPFDIFS